MKINNKKIVLALTLVSVFAFNANAENAPKENSGFVVHKLSDSLYAIGEPTYYQANYSYLIVGDDKALMLDAGANQKEDITKVIKTITNKPVSVLPSHLHFDHIGGLHNFDSIYLLDTEFTRKFKQKDGLYHVPESVYLGNFDKFVLEPFKVSRLVKPNDVIDLGGVKLKLLGVPGHTQDEVALYDEKNNVLLSGDHLYPSSLFVGNMNDYVDSVSATLNIINKNTAIYGAHAGLDPNQVPKMTYEQIELIRDKLKAAQNKATMPDPFPGSDLVKSTHLYNVDKEVSILSDIEFKDGRKYGY
ncbi:MBL fold metallo-hydrolase [Pseudomonas putida]|uniref:MBL fold metallo-hydrolase n=1 Tax=Pseudomonas putida TaxID=303 RepID=A0A2Z4RG98_PSEPU|nr:MBL fold metallo-hydrolase [Pseudomonas putida]AWY39879.1 MBL fold metallo-hydrolase [Pseudomonas putida]